jgi:DNA-binding MarR family transcriptional regulator
MNRFTMQGYRTERALAVGPDGRLFDTRLRQAIGEKLGEAADLDLHEALAALRTADHALRVLTDRWTERHGLNDGRLRLLFLLGGSEQTLSQLAIALEVSPRNVTGLVDVLERDGLAERLPDVRDRRAVRARLTDRGRERLRLVTEEITVARRTLAGRFTTDELRQLRHLCLKLLQSVDDAQGGTG